MASVGRLADADEGDVHADGTAQTNDTYVDNSSTANLGNEFRDQTTMLVQSERDEPAVVVRLASTSRAARHIPTTGGADTATLKLTITSAPTASRTSDG